MVAAASSHVLPWPIAAGVALALGLAVGLRLTAIGRDRRKPAWVTRFVDEPMFVHWGAVVMACALALPVALGLWMLGQPLRASTVALVSWVAGFALAATGTYVTRRRVQLRHITVELPGLHQAFDGFRIAQLSDLHIGSYDRVDRGLAWAERANALGADLIVVTGDLVTSGTGFYEDAAAVLAKLKAPHGVFAILGNHDEWDPVSFRRILTTRGIVVLANEWVLLEQGAGRLVLSGLDDPYAGRDDLELSLEGRPDGVPTVLLSHYPDHFEAAAKRGVELVLSGHTHGGQLGVPFFGDRFNIATLTGQKARGLYQNGSSSLYVNAGLGTTGPPLRIGIPPEIACITLRAASQQPAWAREMQGRGGCA